MFSAIIPDYNKTTCLIDSLLTEDIFNKVISNKHVDIVHIIHTLYKDIFVCVDISKNKWCEFRGHRWVYVQSAHTLDGLLLSEVCEPIMTFCSKKLEQLDVSDRKNNEYEKYQALIKFAENLIDDKFRSKIIKLCSKKFYDANFKNKLDNARLIGFENGVYDLDCMCFRDGLPTDYVSKTVGYDWKVIDDDTVFEKINNYFSDIQPDKDIKTYLLTFIAKTLKGVHGTKLHVWTGKKESLSTIIYTLKYLLGEYFGIVNDTILSRRRCGSPPELADKSGKRLLIIQESELKNGALSGQMIGRMKKYSCGDMMMGKTLYGEYFYYKPQFTTVLTCSNIPDISSYDAGGTLKRLRVVPFGISKEKIQAQDFIWRQALMWMIITKYYPLYEKGIDGKRYKIFKPQKLKQFTNDYNLDTTFHDFFDECVIENNNDKDMISITRLYRFFKNWYVAAYTLKAPAKKYFTIYIKHNNYKLDQDCQNLIGYKNLQ